MRIGVIGSGFGLYGLLPAFNSTKGCHVVSICGKKTDRLVKFCESIGLKKIYSDWEEMLVKEDLDAIAIAVIPSIQYKIAKVALEKGMHVFAEKPLTANYQQAKELVSLAAKKKCITAVDFIFPEIKEWKKTKEILDSQVYGELQHISVSWDFLSYDIKNKITSWKTDTAEGGGALSFYVSHVLYYLEYYGGEIEKIKSLLTFSHESKNGGETGVDLLLKFKKSHTGSVHFNCNAVGYNTHRVVFLCEKATLILESARGVTENFTLTAFSDKEKIKVFKIKKNNYSRDQDERVEVVKKIATRFVESCKKGEQMSPSFIQGLKVQQLIEKIRKHNN